MTEPHLRQKLPPLPHGLGVCGQPSCVRRHRGWQCRPPLSIPCGEGRNQNYTCCCWLALPAMAMIRSHFGSGKVYAWLPSTCAAAAELPTMELTPPLSSQVHSALRIEVGCACLQAGHQRPTWLYASRCAPGKASIAFLKKGCTACHLLHEICRLRPCKSSFCHKLWGCFSCSLGCLPGASSHEQHDHATVS